LRIKYDKDFRLFMDFNLVCRFLQYYVKLNIWTLSTSQAKACGYGIFGGYPRELQKYKVKT